MHYSVQQKSNWVNSSLSKWRRGINTPSLKNSEKEIQDFQSVQVTSIDEVNKGNETEM